MSHFRSRSVRMRSPAVLLPSDLRTEGMTAYVLTPIEGPAGL